MKIERINIDSINNKQYCVELIVGAVAKNSWIKGGYIDKVEVIPLFLNPKNIEYEKYIRHETKYIDKKNIAFMKKTHIKVSILLYSKSLTYMKDQEFKVLFFDNYNNPIEFKNSDEPATLYFSYYESL